MGRRDKKAIAANRTPVEAVRQMVAAVVHADNDLSADIRDLMNQRGVCLELAWRLCQDLHGSTLVHAVVDKPGKPWFHAFVELDGCYIDLTQGERIWEVAKDRTRFLHIRRYAQKEAWDNFFHDDNSNEGSYGPWEEELNQPQYFKEPGASSEDMFAVEQGA